MRRWRDDDLEPWAAMNADPHVMRFFPSVNTAEKAKEVADRARALLERDGYGWWVAEIKGGAPFAGVIALQEVPFVAKFTPAVEIGWRLAPAFWGRGYATEGARRVLAFAFGELGLSEVVAMTAAINEPSRRVMERLGMTYDPRDDFEHPKVEAGHAVRPHVLYRIAAPKKTV